jgi:hypothetical protein
MVLDHFLWFIDQFLQVLKIGVVPVFESLSGPLRIEDNQDRG